MAEGGETASSTSCPSPSSSSSSSTCKEEKLKQPQTPGFPSFPPYPNGGDFQMFPIMYPAMLPAFTSNPLQNQQQSNNGNGAGIYAVPVPSFMGPIAGLPSNTLIPLTFNLPTRRITEAGVTGDPGQGVQQPQQQQQQQQPAAQRQIVVRRFQIAFQLDLLLILKLAAVIFLFNQEGSRQRLIILVILASLVYFYQTGALAPLVRWLSQSMQRAAAPPRPPRPAVRAENPPGAARQNENVAFAEGHVGAENVNLPAEDANHAGENVAEAGGENAVNHWWGIVKEIQMIVFGFITSLLPGFHNMD